MIVTILYFLLFCFLIYRTRLFGLLKDDTLKPGFYLGMFLIKCTGLLAFYLVYEKLYGGIRYFDTWHFYHDSRLVYDIWTWDAGEFFKVMTGTYSDSPDAEVFKKFISNAEVWDKDPGETLYNDNRLVIRLHALLQFISFGQYWVHALFSCLFSLIGIHWIYKAFKWLFPGKEEILFLAWVLFPGMWFWSGNFLKEAPALLLMGGLLYTSKLIFIDKIRRLRTILPFVFCAWLCFFLKHYIMLPLLFFTLVFFIVHSSKLRRQLTVFFSGILILMLAGVLAFRIWTGRSLLNVLAYRQHTFVDASKGGIFLTDSVKFVRIAYDLSLVKLDSVRQPVLARIAAKVPMMYWEHSHQSDTLYAVNSDTAAVYNLQYYIVPANATLYVPPLDGSFISLVKALPYALYNTLLKPFFYDARNVLDLLASLENLLLLLCILVWLKGLMMRKSDPSWPVYFIVTALSIFIVIGLSSPNIGAIERYRALVAPFVLMAALYYSSQNLLRFFRR